MSGESCPLPSGPADPDAAPIERMIRAHRIVVVGLSDDPSRPSFGVASYLLAAGKQIIPINPNHDRDFVQNRCLMVEHMRHAGSD